MNDEPEDAQDAFQDRDDHDPDLHPDYDPEWTKPQVDWRDNRVRARVVNERMQKLGWSQADVVKYSGLSDLTIRKIQEAPKGWTPRFTTLARLALALGADDTYTLAHLNREQLEQLRDALTPDLSGELSEKPSIHELRARVESAKEKAAGSIEAASGSPSQLTGILGQLLEEQRAMTEAFRALTDELRRGRDGDQSVENAEEQP